MSTVIHNKHEKQAWIMTNLVCRMRSRYLCERVLESRCIRRPNNMKRWFLAKINS